MSRVIRPCRYPGDYVLIKEEGWVVSSVVWAKHATGNPLFGKWTGLSIHPDKDTPTASNDFQYVDIVVMIEGLITGNAIVTLTEIDPPNASGTGAANNGGPLIFATNPLTFTNATTTQRSKVKLGLNAGDNYIIEATPSNGTPSAYSEILTVWRRLWMELDQMETPQPCDPNHGFSAGDFMITRDYAAPANEPDDFDVATQPDKPDILLLTSAMVAACVTVSEVPQDSNHDSWRVGDTNGSWDITTAFIHNIPTDFFFDWTTLETIPDSFPSTGQGISQATRDVNALSSEFWVMHTIGAYEYIQDDGDVNATCGRNYGNGVFMVFDEAIRDFIATFKDPDAAEEEASTIPLTDAIRGCVFHETLHSFGLTHEDGGIMYPNFAELKYEIQWQILLDCHIRKIQETVVPN